MRFYDREAELKALEKARSSKGSEMVIISGRRRVGKSRLVDEFLKGKGYAKVLVVPKEEKQVVGDFANALADELVRSFSTVKEVLEYFFTKSDKRILFVDEFPNFIEVNPSIPYEFQGAWEKHKSSSSKVLIFSGSYVSMMDRIFTRQKAPLFNRAGYSIVLQPFKLKVAWEIQHDLRLGAEEKARNYCIFGGIPYYYELIEKLGGSDPVNGLFFDVAAPLKEEGQNILRQEFGSAYKKYFSIIEAIGAGLVSAGEIAAKLGVSQTTLSKYIVALQRDFQLVERVVPFGQNPARSKKGLYCIKDNTTAFWFARVYGKTQPPGLKELNEFIGRRFEGLCMEFLVSYLENKGEAVVKAGRWWGRVEARQREFEEREIDIVVETGNTLYLGECKWTGGKVGERELNRLQGSAKALKAKKPVKFVLFSKGGFSIGERADVLLFDLKRIEHELSFV